MGLPIPLRPVTSGSIVTNGTGRPVPYCADCTLFVNVGNGLDRSVTNAKSTT